MKNKEGITLIALIITIIIMLILVSVSIQVLMSSGLFDRAADATSDWNNAQENEGQLGAGNIQIDDGDTTYNSIDEFLASQITIEPGDKVEKTNKYKDTNNDVAVIPGGFTVSGVLGETTISEGLVIYLINDKTAEEIATIDWTNETTVANLQKTYDQFVWIPIKNTTDENAQDINDMYICQAKTAENGKCNITVENGAAKCTTHNSTQMAGRLYATVIGENFEKGYTEVYTAGTGLREPDIVTGPNGTSYDAMSNLLKSISTILGTTTGYDTKENFQISLQQEYNEVVKSVYLNQGFYISRYEVTGIVNTNTNVTVKSVAGTTSGLGNATWYRMYAQMKKYADNRTLTSVKSMMIQGAAYDQVMKFIENGERPDENPYTITTSGNVGHYSSEGLMAQYQTGGLNYPGTVQYNDKVKNIYDLEGNVQEYTTEASGTSGRVIRGSSFQSKASASYRYTEFPLYNRRYIRFTSPNLYKFSKLI